MNEKKHITLEPHPDIELSFKRQDIDITLTMPEFGINNDTGIILVIDGFATLLDVNAQKPDLHSYLADKLNCIAVKVNYFGIYRKEIIRLTQAFFNNFNRIYKQNLSLKDFNNCKFEDELFRIITQPVLERGVTSVDFRCQPTLVTGRGEYQSWGLLPAIDCLQALGYVLKTYGVNSKRTIAYGREYGAYVALLLGKFAPQTFSVIIDREGYSRAELKHIACGEVMEADYTYAFHIRHSDLLFTITAGSNNPWTILDEHSRFYFSDSHRLIRNLLITDHRIESETRYYILHSEESGVTSINDKDSLVEILRNYNRVYYNRIPLRESQEESNLGNKYFQAMQLHKLSDHDGIDWVINSDEGNMASESEDNDFTLNSCYSFKCGVKSYEFKFNDDYNLHVGII